MGWVIALLVVVALLLLLGVRQLMAINSRLEDIYGALETGLYENGSAILAEIGHSVENIQTSADQTCGNVSVICDRISPDTGPIS